MERPSTRALLVYPRFAPNSFWNYRATCEAVGARYSAAPLSMITVAALLPKEWDVRLLDRNIEELDDADLDWADVVMLGGMLPQQHDALSVIERAHARGKPVVVGGPDVSCSPQRYETAEFRVLGESEAVIDQLVDAWNRGERSGTFRAPEYPDVRKSPIPRFDLLKLEHYMHVGVQVSRGCPFSCEFCNVIELNGRKPRLKDTDQVLRELEALYALGYRGHVDFVDDNLIGDRRAIKPFLAQLADWVAAHDYPFEFSSEVSLNLADDAELLALMKRANFFAVFVGIETPDGEALRQAAKKQNVGRDVGACMRAFYKAGLFVNAGFIVGFDSESGSVAAAMERCIEEAAIPICMVGLLYALPNTQLARRLASEGRLHADFDQQAEDDADQCTSGLNFETLRPRVEILRDYRTVIERIYEPGQFFRRTSRMARALDVRGHTLHRTWRHTVRDLKSFARISVQLLRDREVRLPYLRAFWDALVHNPLAVKHTVSMAALYLHYKPFARHLAARLSQQIEAAEKAALRAAAG